MFKNVVLFHFFINFSGNFLISIAFKSHSSVCKLISPEPLPYDTLSPINVISKDAQLVNVTSPVILQNGVLGPLLIKNSGYALEVFGNPEVISGGATYGGILCGHYFIFHKLRFYVSQDINGHSYSEINGKGGPLTLSIIYYNSKYGSFNKSLYHRDGLVIQDFQSSLSLLPNLLFDPVGVLIRLLREPGSEMYVNEGLAYAWFDRIPFIHHYYAFPGSYVDLETGKQYQSATVILTDNNFHLLSKSQFKESFLQLKDVNHNKLDNSQPLYPAGQRPIYKANGFKGLFIPF